MTTTIDDDLAAAGLDPAYVTGVIRMALAEDLGDGGDVTSEATIPAAHQGVAELVARGSGVLAGLPVAAAVFEVASSGELAVQTLRADGETVRPGEVVAVVRGAVRQLLTAERTALNLLCHLSGVATATRRWAEALAGTGAVVRDTRKTTPGLRALEKYAVRCGGGSNHRMSLSDQALIKDNHVLAAGGVVPAYTAVRTMFAAVPVEVECTTVEQVRQLLAAGAERLLLDNMATAQMAEAVRLARGCGHPVIVEASGGLTLERAREVAATGVDVISVGALTHSAPVLDIAMDLRGD